MQTAFESVKKAEQAAQELLDETAGRIHEINRNTANQTSGLEKDYNEKLLSIRMEIQKQEAETLKQLQEKAAAEWAAEKETLSKICAETRTELRSEIVRKVLDLHGNC